MMNQPIRSMYSNPTDAKNQIRDTLRSKSNSLWSKSRRCPLFSFLFRLARIYVFDINPKSPSQDLFEFPAVDISSDFLFPTEFSCCIHAQMQFATAENLRRNGNRQRNWRHNRQSRRIFDSKMISGKQIRSCKIFSKLSQKSIRFERSDDVNSIINEFRLSDPSGKEILIIVWTVTRNTVRKHLWTSGLSWTYLEKGLNWSQKQYWR